MGPYVPFVLHPIGCSAFFVPFRHCLSNFIYFISLLYFVRYPNNANKTKQKLTFSTGIFSRPGTFIVGERMTLFLITQCL